MKSLMLSLLLAGILLCFVSPFPQKSSVVVLLLAILLTSRLRSLWRNLICVILFFGFLVFSSYSSRPGTPLWSQTPSGHYAELASNFLKGKLYLPDLPDPRLLALENPYDPSQRNNIPFDWDCSLYKGKYYLYWGVAPIVSFILPVYKLTSKYPLEVTTGIWFGIWGAVFGFLLLMRILEKTQGKPATGYQLTLGALIFLLSAPYGYLLRYSHIYELALLSGHAYSMLALYWCHRLSDEKEFKPLTAFSNAGMGICYALAVASRPPTVLLFPAFLAMIVASESKHKLKQMTCIASGFLPVFAATLLYNYLRYENPFEFGFFYQLNYIKMSEWGFSWKDCVFSSAAFLFQWPKVLSQFPYTEIQRFGENWLVYRHRYMNDQVIGLLFAAPYSVFLLWDRNRIFTRRNHRVLVVLFGVGLLLMMVSGMAGLNTRYEMEFLPLLIIPALAWSLAEIELTQSFVKRTFVLALGLYAIQFGFFASFSLDLQAFESANPMWTRRLGMWLTKIEPQQPPTINVEYLMRGIQCSQPRPNPQQWLIQLQRRK